MLVKTFSVTARWAKQTWSAHRPANLLHLSLRGHGRRFTQNTLEKQTNLEISPNFHVSPSLPAACHRARQVRDRGYITSDSHGPTETQSSKRTINKCPFVWCLLAARQASRFPSHWTENCFCKNCKVSSNMRTDSLPVEKDMYGFELEIAHTITSKNKHGTKNRPIQKLLVKVTGIIQKSYRTTAATAVILGGS